MAARSPRPAAQQPRERRPIPTPFGEDADLPVDVYEYDFSGGQLRSPWLPLPYPAASVDAVGSWRYDDTTLDVATTAEEGDAAGLDWTAVGRQPAWTPELLNAAGSASDLFLERWTALPDSLPAAVPDLARQIVPRRGTDYARAARSRTGSAATAASATSLAPTRGRAVTTCSASSATGPVAGSGTASSSRPRWR